MKRYVDDLTFWLDTNGDRCEIVALSVSQPVSIYDYDTNFCNLWNLFFNAPFNFSVHYGNEKDGCKFHPDQGKEKDTCAKY